MWASRGALVWVLGFWWTRGLFRCCSPLKKMLKVVRSLCMSFFSSLYNPKRKTSILKQMEVFTVPLGSLIHNPRGETNNWDKLLPPGIGLQVLGIPDPHPYICLQKWTFSQLDPGPLLPNHQDVAGPQVVVPDTVLQQAAQQLQHRPKHLRGPWVSLGFLRFPWFFLASRQNQGVHTHKNARYR